MFPFFVHIANAANGSIGDSDSVSEFVGRINTFIINPIIAVLFGLALVFFLWGLVEFIGDSTNEISRERGKKNITWGLFGMFVMFAVFAIINIIAQTIGADVPGTIGG